MSIVSDGLSSTRLIKCSWISSVKEFNISHQNDARQCAERVRLHCLHFHRLCVYRPYFRA